MRHKAICINRLCGSGGHIIGEMAAKELGIGYYDKNLLELALDYGEISSSKKYHSVDEKATNPAFYRLQYEGNDKVDKGKPANETLFQLQRDYMKEIVAKEDCVLIGRCADFVLANEDVDMLSVLVVAPLEERVAHLQQTDNLNARQATAQAKKIDKRRGDYYNYFTKRNWKNWDHYDLILNSATLGYDTCVKLLIDYYKNIL